MAGRALVRPHGMRRDMVRDEAFDAHLVESSSIRRTASGADRRGNGASTSRAADYVLWRMLLWFFRGHAIQVPVAMAWRT